MIEVSRRKVSRTGVASLGWVLGRGYVQSKLAVKAEVWCVVEDGDVIVECRSKGVAVRVADALREASQW